MSEDWRQLPGARQPGIDFRTKLKLSHEDVEIIRDKHKHLGATQAELAIEYGVSCGYIHEILVGRRRAAPTPYVEYTARELREMRGE